jgi:hypothetical protein
VHLALGAMIAAAHAAHAAPAPPARVAPSSLEAFLHELAQRSCQTVKQLEPMLGPVRDRPLDPDTTDLDRFDLPVREVARFGVTKVTMTLKLELGYRAIGKLSGAAIGELTLALDPRAPRARIAQILGELDGSTQFAAGGTTVWHAGDLYFARGADALNVICGNPPPWAQRPWTDRDVKAFSSTLVAVLDRKDVAGFVKDAANPRSSVLAEDRIRIDRENTAVAVTFRTPMPGGALLAAVGANPVILQIVDGHRVYFRLARKDGSPIVYNGWRLEITVDDSELDKFGRPRPTLDIDRLLVTGLGARPTDLR